MTNKYQIVQLQIELLCVFFGISLQQLKVCCSSINFEVKYLYIFCEMAEEKCWIETRKFHNLPNVQYYDNKSMTMCFNYVESEVEFGFRGRRKMKKL